MMSAGDSADSVCGIGSASPDSRATSEFDNGEVKNRAELARREGITRARVTQIMDLLPLAPDIQRAIPDLPAGTPERVVTERKLPPSRPGFSSGW